MKGGFSSTKIGKFSCIGDPAPVKNLRELRAGERQSKRKIRIVVGKKSTGVERGKVGTVAKREGSLGWA